MTNPRYLIGCGFHANGPHDWRVQFFRDLWLANTLKHSQPEKIVVISSGDTPIPGEHPLLTKIQLQGSLGYCGELLHGSKPGPFTTCTMTWVALAMLAYLNECDLVYKESDTLWFGPCVQTMQQEIGDGGIIFGHRRSMPAATSLWYLKHRDILRFVNAYLNSPPELTERELAEHKFQRWHMENPHFWRKFSFGVDADRPMTFDAPCWYAQKLNLEELRELKLRGLL